MPAFQAEIAFEGLKRRKSLSVDQITTELALEGSGTVKSSMILLSVFRLTLKSLN